MTQDEYKDFVLRYKGCGACFPMYHTLNRFEKMWFTAIQKDVAELEAQIEKTEAEAENYLMQVTRARWLLKNALKLLKLYKKTNDLETVKEIQNFLKESE